VNVERNVSVGTAPRGANTGWRFASGTDLYGLYQEGRPLATLLPETPAVYMWKLRLRNEGLVVHDPDRTLRQLSRITKISQGSTQPISTSHGLKLLGIDVCGPGLPGNKKKVLAKFLSRPANSRWMLDYLEELEQHLPALYVGETGNLSKRAFDHLSGVTDFARLRERDPDLTWGDLNLYYTNIGGPSDADSPLRKAVEYITAVVTVSAFTQRPG
jgi:hypothetical protein